MNLTVEMLLVLLFHAVLAPATSFHALLYKRDSRSAFGWIAACILAPVAGPLLYLFFGLNRTRSQAQTLGLVNTSAEHLRGAAFQEHYAQSAFVLDEYRTLARRSKSVSIHPLVGGNRVEMLFNGEQAYPAMLEAIAQARSHVLLSTYIFDHDKVGRAFKEALAAAVGRGVDVRVMVDGIGEWYSLPRASRVLRRAGIRVERFLPPRLLPPSFSINMCNHHKLLVVDDQVGFTGGMNIRGNHCFDDPDNRHPTADVHFRLAGPVVLQLRQEFFRVWAFSTNATDEPPLAKPPVEGALACRTVTGGPDEDLDRLTMLLNAAIAQARHSIRIMTPYFLPPRELIGAIKGAAVRGVKVQIVLPEKNNLRYIHWATRNMLWEIFVEGVEVYYQPPPFNHAKLFVVDGRYSLIGSTNWDPRSLRLNFELQVEIYGEAFATQLNDYFDRAVETGRQVTLEEVDGRSLPVRFRDSLCWLFSPYL